MLIILHSYIIYYLLLSISLQCHSFQNPNSIIWLIVHNKMYILSCMFIYNDSLLATLLFFPNNNIIVLSSTHQHLCPSSQEPFHSVWFFVFVFVFLQFSSPISISRLHIYFLNILLLYILLAFLHTLHNA